MSIYLNSANVASGAAGQGPEKHLAQEPSTWDGFRMPGIPPFFGPSHVSLSFLASSYGGICRPNRIKLAALFLLLPFINQNYKLPQMLSSRFLSIRRMVSLVVRPPKDQGLWIIKFDVFWVNEILHARWKTSFLNFSIYIYTYKILNFWRRLSWKVGKFFFWWKWLP